MTIAGCKASVLPSLSVISRRCQQTPLTTPSVLAPRQVFQPASRQVPIFVQLTSTVKQFHKYFRYFPMAYVTCFLKYPPHKCHKILIRGSPYSSTAAKTFGRNFGPTTHALHLFSGPVTTKNLQNY